MGRKINAGVSLLINEEDLSTYVFLILRAKKNKRQPQVVELGVDRFTSR